MGSKRDRKIQKLMEAAERAEAAHDAASERYEEIWNEEPETDEERADQQRRLDKQQDKLLRLQDDVDEANREFESYLWDEESMFEDDD